MYPSLVYVVANTSTKMPDNLHNVSTGHSSFVVIVALASPTLMAYVVNQSKFVISFILLKRNLIQNWTNAIHPRELAGLLIVLSHLLKS